MISSIRKFGFTLAMTLLCGTHVSSAQAEPVSIGAVIPLSGASATIGADQLRGIEIATEEVNAKGGVLGQPLKVIVEDSGGRPPSALDAARKLVTVNNVPLVIGEYSSGNTLPIGQYLVQQKRIHLNPASTSGLLRDLGEGHFSLVGLDHVTTKFAADDIMAQGWRKAVIIAPNNAFGQGVIEQFTKHFKAVGGQVLASIAYPEGQTTYRRELQQLAQAKPDVFVYSAYSREGAVINREASELGLNETPWYGYLLSMSTADSDPKTKQGQYGLEVNYIGPNGGAYQDAYKKKYGEDFRTTWNGYTYDAVKIAAAAINKAGSTDPAAIGAALKELGKGYEGATGQITFDANRMRDSQPYLKMKVDNGKLVLR